MLARSRYALSSVTLCLVISFPVRAIFRFSKVHTVFSGPTGLGKSTLINTIFASHLIDSKGRFVSDEPVRQTTEIQAASHGEPFS